MGRLVGSGPVAILLPLVLLAGAAGLGWEVLWALQSTLALGQGAKGAAVTLAATMGGMAVGSLAMGRWVHGRDVVAGRLYGALEIAIGLWGLALLPAFALVERLDGWTWQHSPAIAGIARVAAIAIVLGPPAVAMGATLPLFVRLGRGRTSAVYAANVVGAATGALVLAFALVPMLGVHDTIRVLSAVDVAVGVIALALLRERVSVPEPPLRESFLVRDATLLALATGFATFTLEVAWFRVLRAAFNSTTEGFAIMLSSFLVAIAGAAAMAPALARRGISPARMVLGAGLLVLGTTPVIERYPLFVPTVGPYYTVLVPLWILQCIAICGPAIAFLGTALPNILDAAPARAPTLYAINTAGAVAGSLVAAWILLPTIGLGPTSWLVGGLLVAVAFRGLQGWERSLTWLAVPALGLALVLRPSLEQRVTLGFLRSDVGQVLAHDDTPDGTLAVVAIPSQRMLVIDGFVAAGEARLAHYMAWMGRLPMMLAGDPERALVICFGTGQTAHAVLTEGAAQLDIVDVNPGVFALADQFPSNGGVLHDPRVRTIAMDGRAWLRRNDATYDVITMEPMAPFQAGVNALYSKEFYELARRRLAPDGVVAQWLPFHLVPQRGARSIVAAFLAVFPNAMLWFDPIDHTGILLGTPAETPIGRDWPGLDRDVARDLARRAILGTVQLGAADLQQFSQGAVPVTDDNQALAYGRLPAELMTGTPMLWPNLVEIQQLFEAL
jgi:spermidine synthase